MKTVIIPSDFSEESIQVAKAVVSKEKSDVRVIFTHLFHVADDIQDLLFSNYRKKEYEFVSDEFRSKCEELKEMYGSKLKEVKIEFFYGNKLASFKNFLDYNEADYFAYSERNGIPRLCKSSIEALPVIKRCNLSLLNVDEMEEPELAEVGQAR